MIPQLQSRHRWTVLFWLVLAIVASLQVFARTSWQTDLTAFLPQADTLPQQILMAEIRRGNSSRLWMIGLSSGSSREKPDLAMASQMLLAELSTGDSFSSVQNSSRQFDPASRDLLFRYRYLLQSEPDDFSVDSLKLELEERLLELSMPIAVFKQDLMSSDPTDNFLDLLERLEAGLPAANLKQHNGAWFTDDGTTALLFARSVSSSMDAEGQAFAYAELQLAVNTMRSQVPQGNSILLELAGAPLIALKTSEQTRAASIRLSIWASVFMILLLLLAYRSPAAVFMASLPPLLAILFATAVSSLLYPTMHVLTIAFGITLLGVALDYPVHVLSHQKAGESLRESARRIWPTLRIGVLTTIFAFAALTWSDFEGIVRLGVFSIAGLITAALASRYLLPVIAELPGFKQRINPAGLGRLQVLPDFHIQPMRLAVVGLIFLILLGFGVSSSITWSDDIAALSPVSSSLIQQEQQLRSKLHLPEPGAQILLYAESIDELLSRELALMPLLERARRDRLIGDWEMAATLLPPIEQQYQRQQRLPEEGELRQKLKLALEDLPFVAAAFDDFISDVERSKHLAPLTVEMFVDTPLAEWLDSLIIDLGAIENGATGFGGIVRFTGLTDVTALQERVQSLALPQTWLLQTRNEVSLSLQKFRLKLSQLLFVAAAVIALVLVLLLRQPARVLRILMVVTAAVMGAAGISWLLSGSLNLLHLLSLILVAGIGIDYALFFTRGFKQPHQATAEKAATLHALLVCLLSSTAVFFLLATSGIKVLESIGMVVTAGVILAFTFSLLAGFSMNRFGTEEKPIYNKNP
ncbi:MAG: hypothetical protein IMF09_03755 [Proteobacteria bacterium]|nr:hypothetical protein [Pseudomonadota bacterium]